MSKKVQAGAASLRLGRGRSAWGEAGDLLSHENRFLRPDRIGEIILDTHRTLSNLVLTLRKLFRNLCLSKQVSHGSHKKIAEWLVEISCIFYEHFGRRTKILIELSPPAPFLPRQACHLPAALIEFPPPDTTITILIFGMPPKMAVGMAQMAAIAIVRSCQKRWGLGCVNPPTSWLPLADVASSHNLADGFFDMFVILYAVYTTWLDGSNFCPSMQEMRYPSQSQVCCTALGVATEINHLPLKTIEKYRSDTNHAT